MNIDYTNKMWADIFEEMANKGDALLDLYDSVCIVALPFLLIIMAHGVGL